MANEYVPFPLNVTLSSPLFQLTPPPFNGSAGWAPSCTSSACASTAIWSTGVANSTLSFTFWGKDVTFDGSVQGDMNIQVLLDGQEVALNPSSNGTLFSIPSLSNRNHSVSLSVLSASSGSLLSINQARINASTLTDQILPSDEWELDSNDRAFSYTGFVQQASPAGLASPTNYISSSAGDTTSLQFNGSAVAIYGPCGPSNGLMRVTIDGEQTTVNTSKPIQADDCLLYLSKGLEPLKMHELVVTNEDGRELGINRMQFIRALLYDSHGGDVNAKAGVIVGIVAGVVVSIALLIILFTMRTKKTRQKMSRSFAIFCG